MVSGVFVSMFHVFHSDVNRDFLRDRDKSLFICWRASHVRIQVSRAVRIYELAWLMHGSGTRKPGRASSVVAE